MELTGLEYMAAQRIDQRCKQSAGSADPTGKRGSVEVDAFAGIDLLLPMQWGVVRELRDENMCKQPWSSIRTRDRPRWGRGFNDSLAAAAAELRTHMADDLEALRHILEDLGDIFTELAQRAAAAWAAACLGKMCLDFTRQMFGKRTARGSTGDRLNGCCFGSQQKSCYFFFAPAYLKLFQLQVQLLDLSNDLLALGPEEHPLQLIEQQLEMSDLAGP